jgi:ketosteroid isomerase-like protein
MVHMGPTQNGTGPLDRLLEAVNDHDLERLVACFAEDYVNETPAHPERSFRGNQQVRTNWRQILAGIAGLRAEVPRRAAAGDLLWTEWDMSGTRADGGAFVMRGVVIFGIAHDLIRSARFYLEPVEVVSGGVDAHTRRVVAASVGTDREES